MIGPTDHAHRSYMHHGKGDRVRPHFLLLFTLIILASPGHLFTIAPVESAPIKSRNDNAILPWSNTQPSEIVTGCTYNQDVVAIQPDYSQPDLWFILSGNAQLTLVIWNSTCGACQPIYTAGFNSFYSFIEQDTQTGHVYLGTKTFIYQFQRNSTATPTNQSSSFPTYSMSMVINITGSEYIISSLCVQREVLFFITTLAKTGIGGELNIFNLTSKQYLATYNISNGDYNTPSLSINRDLGEVLVTASPDSMWAFNLSTNQNVTPARTIIPTPPTSIVLYAYRLTKSKNFLLLTGSTATTAVQLWNGTNLTTLLPSPALVTFNPVIDQANQLIYFGSTASSSIGVLVYDLQLGTSSILSGMGGGFTLVDAVAVDRLSSRIFMGTDMGLYSINGRSLTNVAYRTSFVGVAVIPNTGVVWALTEALPGPGPSVSSPVMVINGMDTINLYFKSNCSSPSQIVASSTHIFLLCMIENDGLNNVFVVDAVTYQPISIVPGSDWTQAISVTTDDSVYLSLQPNLFGPTQLYSYNITNNSISLIYELVYGDGVVEVAKVHGVVYFVGSTSTLFFVNSTNQINQIDLSVYPCNGDGIQVNEMSQQLYINCGNTLLVWDIAASVGVLTPVLFNAAANSWWVDPFNQLLYLATNTFQDSMLVMDLDTQLSWQVTVSGCLPTGLALDLMTGVAIFVCYDGTVIYTSTNYHCQPGYSWVSGRCSPCSAGTFNGPIDQRTKSPFSFCSPCAIGSVAPQLGSAACELCPLGRYQDPTQFQVCSLCPPGTYQNMTGSTTCEICPIGSYADSPGSSSCTLCAPGSFSLTNQSSTCQLCNRNSYNPAYGLDTPCQLCPAGEEALILGATTCTTCVLGSYSLTGDSCRTCPLGEYVPSPGLPCITCLEPSQAGLYCVNGLASVKPGWWPYQTWSDQFNTFIYQTTPCPIQELCPGTLLQFLNESLINGTDPSNLITYCQFPRENSPTNWLCGGCAPGYLVWGETCDQCTQMSFSILVGLLIFSILLVLFLYRSGTTSAGQLAILIFFLQTSALELDSVSSYLAWLQFVNFGSNSIHTCLAPLTPLQQQALTFSVPIILIVILGLICGIHACIFYHHQRTKSPLDGAASLLLEDLADSMQTASFNSSPSTVSSKTHTFGPATSYLGMEWYRLQTNFSLCRYVGCIGSILLFCYTSVTVAVVQSMHCVEVAPNQTLLYSMPTVDCNSSEYHSFLPLIYICLVIYIIGLPAIMGIFLFMNRQRLHLPSTDPLVHPIIDSTPSAHADSSVLDSSLSPTESIACAVRSKSSIDLDKIDVYLHSTSTIPSTSTTLLTSSKTQKNYFPLCFGAFYLGFSRRCCWYWQPILLLRRFAFALVSILLIDSNTRYSVFTLIHVSTLLLHTFAQPFHSIQLNRIESGSYLILIYVSVLLTSETPPYSIWLQIILFLLVVPVGVTMIIWTLKHQMNWLMTQFHKFQQKQRRMRKAAQHHDHHPDSFDQSILDEQKQNLAESSMTASIEIKNDTTTDSASASSDGHHPSSALLSTIIDETTVDFNPPPPQTQTNVRRGYGSFHPPPS